MKNSLILVVLVVVMGSFFLNEAQAHRRRGGDRRERGSERSVASTSTPALTSGVGAALRTSTFLGVESAITGWMKISPRQAVQLYLGIGSTSPFIFGFGGQFKQTLFKYRHAGFHLGGGFGVGTVSYGGDNPFFFNFHGLMGTHFRIPGLETLLFNVDAGPHYTSISKTEAAPSQTTFQVGVLAISVNYLF